MSQITRPESVAYETKFPLSVDGHADHAESVVDLLAGQEPTRDITAKATVATDKTLEEDEEDGGIPPEPVVQLDGGKRAWLAVASSFLCLVIVFGIQLSFGVFQAWYPRHDFLDASPAQLSLAGSLGPGSMFVTGIVAGRLTEIYGARPIMFAGMLIMTTGLILASFATQLWHLYLTQGIMYGIGSAFTFYPAVSLPTQWFVKRRALAMGISISGSGVGGILFSNVGTAILPLVGSKWTLRIFGLTSCVLLTLAVALAETHLPKRSAGGPLVDFSLLRDKRFLAIMFSCLVIPFGLLTPYYYLPSYTISVAGGSSSLASTLLTVLNIASIGGRILSGALGDRIGNVNTFILSILIAGLGTLLVWLPAGESVAMLFVYSAIFGFFSGGFIAIMPAIMANVFGVAKLPSILGLMYAVTAIGNLAGNPVMGAIVAVSKESTAFPSLGYGWAILYTAAVWLVGSLGAVYLRFGLMDRSLFKAL
ncbi:major facilitator superfamily domain-containing protein [Blastocladiella britannica]|nr:major facilitator superfamily domain-containing protein [Blastocladiella britannica]